MINAHEFATILFDEYIEITGDNLKYINKDLMIEDVAKQLTLIEYRPEYQYKFDDFLTYTKNYYEPWDKIHKILGLRDNNIRTPTNRELSINALIECYRKAFLFRKLKGGLPNLVLLKIFNYTIIKNCIKASSLPSRHTYHIPEMEVIFPKIGILSKVKDISY